MGVFEIISLIFGVIMAGAGIASQAVANQQNIVQNNLNREDTQAFNAEEAEKARQANIEQYNLLYSPQAKVQQYKDAGLSPALMYSGGGAASAGGTTQMASAGMAGTPTINPIIPQTNIFESMLQSANTEKARQESEKTEKETKKTGMEIKEIEARIKNLEADTGLKIATENNTKLEGKLLENQEKISTATIDEQIEIVRENLRLIENNADLVFQQTRNAEIEANKKNDLFQAQIDYTNQQKNLCVEQQALTIAQTLTEEAKRLLTLHQDKELQKKLEAIESYSYMVVNSGNWQDKGISFLLEACKNLGDKIKELKGKGSKD